MGLTESKPIVETALVKTTNNIIELYQQKTDEMWMHNTLMLQYISVLESKSKPSEALGVPVKGWVLLSERADGSSVKELLVAAWDAVFFLNSGKLDVRMNNGAFKGGDDSIEIDIVHSQKLYEAFVKWRDAECAKFAALGAFNVYMKTDNKL
jgi:hypothetical protein